MEENLSETKYSARRNNENEKRLTILSIELNCPSSAILTIGIRTNDIKVEVINKYLKVVILILVFVSANLLKVTPADQIQLR